MPAAWPLFISSVGSFLDAKIPKTEEETSEFIAKAFNSAVKTSSILMIPGSTILSTPGYKTIERAFLNVFKKIKQEGEIKESTFKELSEALIKYWYEVKWSDIPPPPGFSSPIDGVRTLSVGFDTSISKNIEKINKSLLKVYQSEPTPVAGGIVFATSLSVVFINQMKEISGVYSGNTTALVPGVYPWAGVI